MLKALARGMTARIAVGLSFHLTHPHVLYRLLALSKSYDLELYISNVSDGETFHPKVYAFERETGSSVIVGSANLTAGGFADNYEASILASGNAHGLMQSVIAHFDSLVTAKAVVRADAARIAAYEHEFAIHESARSAAQAKVRRVLRGEESGISLLADKLADMKRDETFDGFEQQRTFRANNVFIAGQRMRGLVGAKPRTKLDFLPLYTSLLTALHSGGLNRGKGRIAAHPQRLVRALEDLLARPRSSLEATFNLLHGHLLGIKGAGINILTELLHVTDNGRFAVMNKNAVAGMRLAGFTKYPVRPGKGNVNAKLYKDYCEDAARVRETLGLGTFTELDALFNYSYWNQ